MKRSQRPPYYRSVRFGALIGVIVIGVLAFLGCGGRPPRAAAPPSAVVGATEEGIASWYGHPYHGRKTANGETYDQEATTAAHRTLPFNTWVKVTNLSNRRTTTVRINDRGPFVDGRIIDLSRRAARAINMLGPGTTRVKLEIVQAPAQTASQYTVQVGAFRNRANAEQLQGRLERQFDPVYIERAGAYFRVRVGRLSSEQEAERLAARLRRRADVSGAVVIRVS